MLSGKKFVTNAKKVEEQGIKLCFSSRILNSIHKDFFKVKPIHNQT